MHRHVLGLLAKPWGRNDVSLHLEDKLVITTLGQPEKPWGGEGQGRLSGEGGLSAES